MQVSEDGVDQRRVLSEDGGEVALVLHDVAQQPTRPAGQHGVHLSSATATISVVSVATSSPSHEVSHHTVVPCGTLYKQSSSTSTTNPMIPMLPVSSMLSVSRVSVSILLREWKTCM